MPLFLIGLFLAASTIFLVRREDSRFYSLDFFVYQNCFFGIFVRRNFFKFFDNVNQELLDSILTKMVELILVLGVFCGAVYFCGFALKHYRLASS